MKRNLVYLFMCLFLATFTACKDEATEDGPTTETEIDNKKDKPQKAEPAKAEQKEKEITTHKNKTESGERDGAIPGGRKDRLLALVNNARAKGCRCGGKYYKPVQPLTWNNRLERAAQKHSRYMRRRNVLGHAGQGGSDAGRRISAEGYDWISYGENVAAGYGSDEATIKGWLKSKGHCKNIMSPKFKEMGMASSGQFYTQVFGTRR